MSNPLEFKSRDQVNTWALMGALSRLGFPSVRVRETGEGFKVELPAVGLLHIVFLPEGRPVRGPSVIDGENN